MGKVPSLNSDAALSLISQKGKYQELRNIMLMCISKDNMIEDFLLGKPHSFNESPAVWRPALWIVVLIG